jgi:hypothetical protein
MSRASVNPGISLEVPSFFSQGETAEALKAFADAFRADVRDSGLRRELSSTDLTQPIQMALYIVGNVALSLLGNAGWAAIAAAYRRFCEHYPGRPISIEIQAEDDEGYVADYCFSDGSDEALRAISGDLKRGVQGTRVHYDVNEGWLTWEEAQAKKYGQRG